MKLLLAAVLMVTLSCLAGCTATRTTLIDVRATLPSSSTDTAYNAVVVALLNAGYDLKMNDRVVHAVATEYKKVANVSGWPPFDFYLRIKALISQNTDGTAQIAITPTMKEQNRLNSNAFTEHTLVLYSEAEQRDDYVVNIGRVKAMLEGQRHFLALVHTIAQSIGLTDAQFQQQLTTAELVGL